MLNLDTLEKDWNKLAKKLNKKAKKVIISKIKRCSKEEAENIVNGYLKLIK